MATSAIATDIFPPGSEAETPLHGGDLAAARRLFPGAPEPFVDLSTGINPDPYPLPPLPAELSARLPDAAALTHLAAAAAQAYGAPSAAHVVAAPGTQILLPLAAGLVRPGRAVVLTPSYGEFARAAALAGHSVDSVRDLDAAADASLVFVCNPNNPDGRIFPQSDLIGLAGALRRRGGLLVADEAFMDVGPRGTSLVGELDCGNIIVLRSFGKFFGLAGLRLGFALAAPMRATRLATLLGPWAVSGPALAVGTQALSDTAWIARTRQRLAAAAQRLDAILIAAGLEIVGGTALFRLGRTPAAADLFQHLGRTGILARFFPEQTDRLRFGLPANEQGWQRLCVAMARFGTPAGQ